MSEHFIVSASPHLRQNTSIQKVMFGVVIALVPAVVGSVYFYGVRALLLILLSCLAALVTEGVIQKARGVPVTMGDGSALVTGILLSFNIPPGVPWWMPVVGSVFAKGVDVVTQATPLAVMRKVTEIIADPNSTTHQIVQAREVLADLGSSESIANLFMGQVGGCIGETSAILLLIGAAYLMFKHYIEWRIPSTYMATVAILTWVFGGPSGLFTGNALFHILAGGLILGAFYMATDMVTSPVSPKGMIIFGVGCGVLTSIIRLVGGYPEGVSYSILLMNVATPLIDRHTRPRKFGEVKKSG
jgi:electron transport complex protein RnfD